MKQFDKKLKNFRKEAEEMVKELLLETGGEIHSGESSEWPIRIHGKNDDFTGYVVKVRLKQGCVFCTTIDDMGLVETPLSKVYLDSIAVVIELIEWMRDCENEE